MLKYVQNSIKGANHVKNEDAAYVINKKNYQLFLVFDGVGSSKNSDDSIRIAQQFVINSHQKYITGTDLDLKQLMFDANLQIVESGINDAFTTYCAVFYYKSGNRFIFSSLGDSRIYTISKKIEQISIDDKDSPDTHIINKCLGDSKLSISDFRQEYCELEGKRILLCTDGFYEFMEIKNDLFYDIFQGVYLNPIKNKLDKEIMGNNLDDSTFILLKE